MKRLSVKVGPADDDRRLDQFLAAQDLGLSRRKIRQIIDVGGVYVNQRRVRIASWAVQRGDTVRVEYSETGLKQIKEQKLSFRDEDLLYDEGGIIAVNKPPGLPSQATLDQSVQHVVPCLQAYFKAKGQKPRRFILVHRLDKETSGVLLLADNTTCATWLTEQFRMRTVKKTYWAICQGIPARATFTEKAHLSTIDKKTGDVRAVRAGGKSAVTHVRTLATNSELGLSLVECRPETGRSHQIRVHLAINDLPIVGDKRYGVQSRKPLPPELADLAQVHQFLHAKALELPPQKGTDGVTIEAGLPPRFAAFLQAAGLISKS